MLIKRLKLGSSIVEIVIYFTVLSIFLVVAMTFAFQITGITAVSEELQEFQANTEFISEKIRTTIITASSVDGTGSVFDDDNGVLSLNMSDALKSPTQFYISDGDIFIKEGEADAIQLNTNDIIIDKANFHRVTYEKTPDQIIIEIQVSPISDDLAQLQRNTTIDLSLSLRNL